MTPSNEKPTSMRPLRRVMREVAAVARAETPTHQHLRERLAAVLAITLVVDLVCGVLCWAFERRAAGSDIHSMGNALFFSSTQLLSVSSSMSNPLTPLGRVLDIGMEAYAITVVAALAGSFGAFFHRRSGERVAAEQATSDGAG
jgi:hypothetical protein